MTEPVALPEWIATEVGNLYLQNAALRRALEEAQRQPEQTPPCDHSFTDYQVKDGGGLSDRTCTRCGLVDPGTSP